MASIKNDYAEIWEDLKISDSDVEFLYNRLFELETPLNTGELVEIITSKKIEDEKKRIEDQKALQGRIYFPRDEYEIGEKISIPNLDWKTGTVVDQRPGNNPDYDAFSVIEVKFDGGETKNFASNFNDHKLNQVSAVIADENTLDLDTVLMKFKKSISAKLVKALENNEDLVQIAGYWFPGSLLVDVNVGYLNLAEAVLEVAQGGPLSTEAILEQIELPTDANKTLTEFSLNYALQEDKRFDEVGPSGETLWYLHRLEPESVKNQPKYLKTNVNWQDGSDKYNLFLNQINADLIDELESSSGDEETVSDVKLSLIYPHWKSGTLPLSKKLESLFPTAYEAPRINFQFVDGNSKKKFDGWVVREHRYVFGLREWYQENEVMPGSILHIKLGKVPGEVIVNIDNKRSSREWIRTVNVDEENRISFAMDKQLVSTDFDERMIIAIPAEENLDVLWEKYENYPFEKLVPILIRELAKLNPQGHVHAQELYAAMNVVKRCSPSYVLYLLENNENVEHLGDMYYKLKL